MMRTICVVRTPAPPAPSCCFRAPAPPAQSCCWGEAERERAVRLAPLVGRGAKPPSEEAKPPPGSPAKVRFDDPLIGREHAGRALRDLFAVIEHEHGFA